MKAFIRSYGAHVLAYAFSALTIVAGLPAPMQAVLGPHAGQIVGIAGILLTAAHNVDKAAIAPTMVPVPSIITAAKMFTPLLVLLLTLPLGACATIQGFFASPQANPVIEVAVDVAVATAEAKGVQAAEINAIAKLALAANSSTGATLATVAAAVNAQIAKLNLPPLDYAAAQILEVAISQAIQARLTNADGTPNTDLAAVRADVATVLNTVIQATGG